MTAPTPGSLAGVHSLYISYFGLREPLVQTQVVPYLRELVEGGASVSLLTFEPEPRLRWDSQTVKMWRERMRSDGIEWQMATYHKRPSLPATLFDVLIGAIRIVRIARRSRVTVLHARSHVPALMGALAKRFTGATLLFDIRGLLADEYVDAGNWSRNGLLYRLTKRVEKYLYRAADAHVVLTERARVELFPNESASRPLAVIPCCFDAERFSAIPAGARELIRARLGASDRTVIVYAGSLGGAYPAKELAQFLAEAKAVDPHVFALILSQSATQAVAEQLAKAGLATADYHVGYVAPDELPAYLAASDIAISMVTPSYSKIAMSPTKFAEYLASGLPVISTRGIGDLDEHIEREKVGVLLAGFERGSYREAFAAADRLRRSKGFREHAAEVAGRLYGLRAVGGVRYRALYGQIVATGGHR
jgi:glycosyltransferase involved in cell wall biosynthesis